MTESVSSVLPLSVGAGIPSVGGETTLSAAPRALDAAYRKLVASDSHDQH